MDPHRAKIDAPLAKYPDISAARVREEIARGPENYTGSAIVIRGDLRTVRSPRGRVYQEGHYEPAQAMHVDWGECGCVQLGATGWRVDIRILLCRSQYFPEVFRRQHTITPVEWPTQLSQALTAEGGCPRSGLFRSSSFTNSFECEGTWARSKSTSNRRQKNLPPDYSN